MAMVMGDRIGLSGPDLGGIVTSLGRLAPPGRPASLSCDDTETVPGGDWPARMARCGHSAMARWPGEEDGFVALHQDRLVRLLDARPADPEAVLADLDPVPFELASFATVHLWHEIGYRSRGFGGLHYPHGWLCAFRGKGHEFLVSRRWLDFGPWRVLRGPGDLTLIQFHDVEADRETAVEQARAGHPLLSVATRGTGLLHDGFAPEHDLNGFYDPASGILRIVVHGRAVTPAEMLDACFVRRSQPLGPSQPIHNVAYVFMEPEAARAHLHDLWLRELECRTIDLGREIRLDEDYHPAPTKPAWVAALETR